MSERRCASSLIVPLSLLCWEAIVLLGWSIWRVAGACS